MVNRFFAISVWAALVAHSAAATDPVRLRACCFDTNKLPKVVTPLDVKRTPSGWPVLNADEFHLLEDGSKTAVADRIVKFRDAGMGLALIVALDASGSMKGRPLAAIQKGLAQLVSRKRSEDRVAVLSFADDTHWETRWDTSDKDTQEAFRNLQARGNLTRLYDALRDANSEFTRQADKDSGFPLRRCILVISDGHDEGSRATVAQLLGDLTNSRIRLDAVGMAHSPLWLGTLRQMARTGFGEFQTASTPEDLTNMLGQGIDSLLDMPALEFQAAHLTADGQTHQIGIDYANAAVHQQISVKLPEPFWRTKLALYAGVGALLLVLLCGLLVWKLRSRSTAAPQSYAPDPPPAPIAPPVPPPLRAATVAEPGSRVMRPAQTPMPVNQTAMPVISYGDPVLQSKTVAKPARVPTELAPHPASLAVKLGLIAISGPYAGQTFPVEEQEFWIGSAANNHLRLPADESVSGNHVCIRTEQQFYRVYDNESLNNTWLNGRAVGKEIAVIKPGDRLRVGASEFLVKANG